MEENKNSLEKLILKEDLNKDILVSILAQFIKIIPSDGKIILLPDYPKLKNKEQIIVLLLAFKAARELGFRDREDVSPREIEQTSQIVGSTIRGILGDLMTEKILIREKGKYRIPNFSLYTLKNRFENLNLEDSNKRNKKGATSKIGKTRKDFSRIKIILAADQNNFIDYLNFLTESGGKYLEKTLLILKISKDKFNIDGLTPAEITEILKSKIRVPRIHQPNISLTLGDSKNSKYVFREAIKGTYIYKLTKPGEDFINNYNFQDK